MQWWRGSVLCVRMSVFEPTLYCEFLSKGTLIRIVTGPQEWCFFVHCLQDDCLLQESAGNWFFLMLSPTQSCKKCSNS